MKIDLNNGNHNYLRMLLVKILKKYWIELFLMELVILYFIIFADYFIYEGGG